MNDVKDYLGLLPNQHRDQPNFSYLIEATLAPLIDCMGCMDELNGYFDLDHATGDQLQIIADWVGAINAIPNAIPIPFFGFDQQVQSLPYSETDDRDFGGYWRDSGVADYTAQSMDIELFRKVIKAKILLNTSDCTPDSAKAIISTFLSKKFKFCDNFNMTITFTFLEPFENWERELVRIMFPIPSGTRLLFEGEDDY